MTRGYNILALRGGGVRGVIEARTLVRLHAATGFLADVDLAVGTSVGGLAALLLAAGRPPEAVLDLLLGRAERVFARSRARRIFGWQGILMPRFSAAPLEAELAAELGDRTLGDLAPCAVTSYNVSRDRSKVWTNRAGDPDRAKLARILGRATSAAPTYFAPIAVDGDLHADGGMTGVNDPTGAALAEAIVIAGRPIADYRVLVVGTGRAPPAPPPAWARLLPWGLLRHLAHGLVGDLIDGPTDHVAYSSRLAFGEHYMLVDPVLPEPIDLADAGRVRDLDAIAAAHDLAPAIAWVRRWWSPSALPPGLTA